MAAAQVPTPPSVRRAFLRLVGGGAAAGAEDGQAFRAWLEPTYGVHDREGGSAP